MKLRVLGCLAFILILSLSSCKKFRMEANVPECIKESAKQKTTSINSPYATILEYEFQGKLVYVFDLQSGEVDSRADIYTPECNFLGYLGGPEKNRMVNGEDFALAVFKRKVWPMKN